ncbi:MAG: hypothetical protein KME30_01365 [Iphinoe sp. HA4291-MV1]|nr:hypothetical protein [Iphinoe sp. HA4291-MV1]
MYLAEQKSNRNPISINRNLPEADSEGVKNGQIRKTTASAVSQTSNFPRDTRLCAFLLFDEESYGDALPFVYFGYSATRDYCFDCDIGFSLAVSIYKTDEERMNQIQDFSINLHPPP